MNPETEITKLLEADGATLLREKNHIVWLLSNGQRFVCSKTPSDHRAAANKLGDLKRLLGLTKQEHIEGERRSRKLTNGAAAPKLRVQPAFNSGLADQLRVTGMLEVNLRMQIAELQALNAALAANLDEMQKREAARWWNRLKQAVQERRRRVQEGVIFWRAMWKSRRHIGVLAAISGHGFGEQNLRNMAIVLRREANGDEDMLQVATAIERELAIREWVEQAGTRIN